MNHFFTNSTAGWKKKSGWSFEMMIPALPVFREVHGWSSLHVSVQTIQSPKSHQQIQNGCTTTRQKSLRFLWGAYWGLVMRFQPATAWNIRWVAQNLSSNRSLRECKLTHTSKTKVDWAIPGGIYGVPGDAWVAWRWCRVFTRSWESQNPPSWDSRKDVHVMKDSKAGLSPRVILVHLKITFLIRFMFCCQMSSR